DPPFHSGRRPMRAADRPAGAVLQPSDAFVLVAAPPLMRALAGDVHRLRRRGHAPAGLDALTQPETTLRGERGITVHLSLLGCVVCLRQLHTRPGGSLLADVNNVPGHNS